PKQREAVLGYTQAFSSLGGLMAAGTYWGCNHFNDRFPVIFGEHEAWRYTLISGVIPAIPLIIIRPFVPEAAGGVVKKKAGMLKRPSFAELFSPQLRRISWVTMILMACVYGVAFGAIQLLPQIVPGLVEEAKKIPPMRGKYSQLAQDPTKKEEVAKIKSELAGLNRSVQAHVSQTQLWQELGGLVGRFALAYLAVIIVSRRRLLRYFQVPGLIVTPIVFFYLASGQPGAEWSLPLLQVGIFVVGFFTVAQFSYWGNYLPRVYPVRL